jgi:opacity protein-like surface antigen
MRLLPAWFILLPILSAGCISTTEVMVDYPLDYSIIERINRSGGTGTILRTDSTVLAVSSLQVDSVKALWLSDQWEITPLAEIRSITVHDQETEESLKLKGIIYSAALFGAIGLTDALVEDRSAVLAETIGAAAAGALLAAYVVPQSTSMLKFTITPPRSEAERVQREADRLRLRGEIPAAQEELQRENRRYRIEPGLLFGAGNGIFAEGDPSSLYAIGGKMSFGYAFWERGELAFEFNLVSHTFQRSNEQEQVTRASFLVTGTYFPLRRSSFFLQAGFGYGFYSAFATYTGSVRTDPPVTPPTLSADGPAVVLGAGIDLGLSEHWSLRPGFRYAYIGLGDLQLNDSVVLASGQASHFFALSLSLVFRGI